MSGSFHDYETTAKQTPYPRLSTGGFPWSTLLRRSACKTSPPLTTLYSAVLMLLVLMIPGTVRAQVMGMDESGPKVHAQAVWLDQQTRQAGQNVLAVVFDIKENWHIASDKAQAVPGSKFNPYFTSVTVKTEDERLTFGEPQFPEAHLLAVGGLPDPVGVYDGRVVIYIPVAVGADAEPGKIKVEVALDYQACDDMTCDFPTQQTVSAEVEIAPVDATITAEPEQPELFTKFDPSTFATIGTQATPDETADTPGPATDTATEPESGNTVNFFFTEVDPSGLAGFIALLVFAAIGGALLNFTPCVLPVIPIKILGLAQTAGNRKKTLLLGSIMAAGVVAFWLGLGITIASVTEFTASNQLFQYPAFSITVGVIIAIMAVGMCGLFAIRLPNFVYAINPKHDSVAGSFGFGVMTAVLSTPCTAPFMGGAAAWAAQQEAGTTLATFAAIGIGMALPYLVLSANPRLVDSLPRTGPGSELLKQIMGLLMLAAAAFFIGAGISGMMSDGTEAAPKGHWWVVAAIVAVAGIWLIARVVQTTRSTVQRGGFATLGILMILVAGFTAAAMTQEESSEDAPINWVYFTPERFDQALSDGNVVLLDFTADWCANCHLLEHTVLNTEAVTKMLRSEGYVAMKVDLTGGYPAGKAKLKEAGSVTIPYLVIYSPDGQVVFNANWYTPRQITDELTKAKSNVSVAASN